MGTATVIISKGTWISSINTASHTSENLMESSMETNIRSEHYSGPSPYIKTAVAQFEIPHSLRYKKFTNAILRFYSTANNTWQGYGLKVAPYLTGDTLDALRYNNVETLGVKGDQITVEPLEFIGPSFPRWRDADITGIFANNIYDYTYFTIFINAFPGMASDNNDWTGIGNASLTDYETRLILTYDDVPQLPPSPSYPVGTYVSENTDLLFAWNWESDTPATQAAVQLEYKLKTAESWTTVSLTQTNHTYLLTGGLSVQGVYQWRIKGTNDAGEVSDYSSIAEFNVVGQPAAPVIDNVPNKALTTITWATTDQNAFDIQIIDSNNKTVINDSVASSVASYKPNIFLKGSYTAKVRVRNSTGLVSDWGTKAFTINAAGPSKPDILLLQNDFQVNISTTVREGTNCAVIRTEEETGKEEILGLMELKPGQSKNLLSYKWLAAREYNGNKVYSITGDSIQVDIIDATAEANLTNPIVLPAGTYTISVQNSCRIQIIVNNTKIQDGGATSRTFTLSAESNVWFKFLDQSVSPSYPLTVGYAQLELGSSPTAYVPSDVSDGSFQDVTFGFGIPYKYGVRAYASAGYTDSNPERICYPKTAVILQTEDDELEINKSEEIYLPYTEDITGEMAVYNCIGRELPVVEHGAFESRAFKTRLYIEDEDQKERLVAMSRKDRIYYRDYSGRAFPVAIQPPITFARWMSEGYMAEMTFIRIADTEVVVNV